MGLLRDCFDVWWTGVGVGFLACFAIQLLVLGIYYAWDELED